MIDITISENSSIIESMKFLAKTGLGCLIVITPKTKILLGTINDGDLRRAILKGNKLIRNVSRKYMQPKSAIVENAIHRYVQSKI